MISDDADDEKGAAPRQVVPFPFSRVKPAGGAFDADEAPLYGTLAAQIGLPAEQTTGHWCSHCRRIWFGYLLEVACPVCGNRHG